MLESPSEAPQAPHIHRVSHTWATRAIARRGNVIVDSFRFGFSLSLSSTDLFPLSFQTFAIFGDLEFSILEHQDMSTGVWSMRRSSCTLMTLQREAKRSAQRLLQLRSGLAWSAQHKDAIDHPNRMSKNSLNWPRSPVSRKKITIDLQSNGETPPLLKTKKGISKLMESVTASIRDSNIGTSQIIVLQIQCTSSFQGLLNTISES